MSEKTTEAAICGDNSLENIVTDNESKGNEFFQDSTPEPETKIQRLERLRITDTTPIQKPDVFLKINGQVFARTTELYSMSGGPKSGKSALQSMLVGGALSENGTIEDSVTGVEVEPNYKKYAVVHIDTEQPRYTHQQIQRTIWGRAGHNRCPDYYISLNLKKEEYTLYQEITTDACDYALEKFGGVYAIFIDGGADFCNSVNDEARAIEAVRYFMVLAEKYQAAVWVIVHTNPGNGTKERGHFGSEIQRKSAGIITVVKCDNISYIDTKLARYTGDEPGRELMFQYNKGKGYHVGISPESPESKQLAKRKVRKEELTKLCESIFGGQMSYNYDKAIHKIMIERTLKERASKDIFKEMKAYELIVQGTDKNWRINDLNNNML